MPRRAPSTLSLLLLLLLSATASAQPTWKLFGNLARARTYFGAIHIGNGEVLVIGGTLSAPSGSNESTASCELIDVNRRTITPAASLNIARAEFVTLLTPDSNVVVIGGNIEDFNRGASTATIELYDRATKQWRIIGSMITERRQHVAAFINDHEILIVGGRSSSVSTIATAEIFDITTGRSRPATSFPFSINCAVMDYSSTGAFLVFAGRAGGSNSYRERSVYRYDLANNRWLLHGMIAEAINFPQMIRLWDGRLAISGGSKREDPVDLVRDVQVEEGNNWSMLATMGVERIWSGMAQFRPNRIMTLGGINNSRQALTSTDWIDLGTGTSNPGPRLIHPHSFFQTVAVPTHFDNGRPTRSAILAISGLTTMSSLTPAVEILEHECEEIVIASPDLTICAGENAALSVTGPPGTYQWSPADGLSCTDCPSPIARPMKTTVYSVRFTDINGCTSSDDVTVSIRPKESIDAGPDLSICSGREVQLSTYGVTGTYQWTPAEGLSCTDCPFPIARPTKTTVYRVTVVGPSICEASDEVAVIVNPVPSVDAGPDITICPGEETLLETTGTVGIYEWSEGDRLSCIDCRSLIVRPSQTTTYRVSVTDSNGCTASDVVTVTVRATGVADAGPDITICPGESARLMARSDAATYRWSPTDGLSCTDCPDPSARPSETTTYRVSATDSNGCTASDVVTVTVRAAGVADAGPDRTICPGESARLMARSQASTYRWSPADGLSCTDCPDPSARPSTTTAYMLTTTSSTGCIATDEVTVQVVTKPIRAHIPRDLVEQSDRVLIVPVILDDSLDDSRIGSIRFSICYDTTMLRLLASTPRMLGLMTRGTLLDGWRINVLTDSGGVFSALFTAPSAADYLRGTGEILKLQYLVTAVLKDSALLDSELPFELAFPGADCYMPMSSAGRAGVTICGFSHRLIEVMNGKYALKQNAPNPFNPTTSIEFSLGLDGHTTLTIHDAAGARVATLVDAYLEPGSHLYEWDASAHPSGLYYYCIVSGEWSRSGRMILLK